jgi:hypothetical protein
MRLLMAALIGGALLSNILPAAAGDEWTLLSPRERRVYHACMTESWIQSWCHWHAWWHRYPQCVLANGGGVYPTDAYGNWDRHCRSMAQGLPPG